MTIIDDNITLNGNALAFKTTATKLEGQHTITVSAKNIYNGIVETQTSVAFVITSIVKVTQKNAKEIINQRVRRYWIILIFLRRLM